MSVSVQSNWLTTVRLNRVALGLRVVPTGPQGLAVEEAIRTIWATCGGPYDEIRSLFQMLQELGLISVQDASVRRSRSGDRVAKAIKIGDMRPLGLILIRIGCFHDQARILIECGRFDGNGNLVCPTKAVKVGAAQLLGILQWWQEVKIAPSVLIPKELVTELNTVWALLPPPTVVPAWAVERKAIGDRAEMYSLQCERTKVADPSQIHWVARDSDSLGWDIEDRFTVPTRCVEVKGRRDHDVLFFLSENEWAKAQEKGQSYEIHFWGGIDLARDPAVEYAELMALGYPLVIRDLPAQVAVGGWEATAVRWRITPKGSSPATRED